MTDHAQNADYVLADDRPFPPPTINRWVRYGGVSLTALVAELRYWADYLEKWAEEERNHA